MGHLLTLLYAPLVLLALRYISITVVAWMMIAVAVIWVFIARNNEFKDFLLPSFYGLGGVMALMLEDKVVLVALPLFIATAFFLFFILPQGGRWLCIMASRFFTLNDKELLYIKKSRFFWAFVAFVNVFIHAIFVLNKEPSVYWAIYASFGWYGVFALGGLLQFIHQKIYFNKELA